MEPGAVRAVAREVVVLANDRVKKSAHLPDRDPGKAARPAVRTGAVRIDRDPRLVRPKSIAADRAAGAARADLRALPGDDDAHSVDVAVVVAARGNSVGTVVVEVAKVVPEHLRGRGHRVLGQLLGRVGIPAEIESRVAVRVVVVRVRHVDPLRRDLARDDELPARVGPVILTEADDPVVGIVAEEMPVDVEGRGDARRRRRRRTPLGRELAEDDQDVPVRHALPRVLAHVERELRIDPVDPAPAQAVEGRLDPGQGQPALRRGHPFVEAGRRGRGQRAARGDEERWDAPCEDQRDNRRPLAESAVAQDFPPGFGRHAQTVTPHSHSIVAGGFVLISYTTRLTPLTSFTMRDETRARNASGSLAQSAVIPSVDVTARSATT